MKEAVEFANNNPVITAIVVIIGLCLVVSLAESMLYTIQVIFRGYREKYEYEGNEEDKEAEEDSNHQRT